jgi:hypothetical protein
MHPQTLVREPIPRNRQETNSNLEAFYWTYHALLISNSQSTPPLYLPSMPVIHSL